MSFFCCATRLICKHTTKSNKTPLINQLLSFLLVTIRPFIGPVYCSFEVGCTTFAVLQLTTRPLFPALWEIVKRLFSCLYSI